VVWRIRDRATFDALRRHGHRARRGPVTVTYVAIGNESVARVAYAVGRRTGSAVRRNRLRRRLRAAVGVCGVDLRSGAYLVAAGPEATRLPFEELRTIVRTAMLAAAEEDRR
jgi:ribonuclease P protein component